MSAADSDHTARQARDLQDALDIVKAAGYVALKAKSYHQAQERHRVSQALLAFEKESSEHTRQWAHRAFDEQRRLGDRLTFVYGVAMAHGATRDELTGNTEGAA